MKYGEILDFRTQDKAVVGKKYVFGEHMFQIATSPEDYDVRILAKVGEDKNFPFLSEKGFKYQFAREIIEEEPKYRPYKNTDELKADFFKDCPDMGKRHRPAIWVVTLTGSEIQIEGFYDNCKEVLINGEYYSMQELFDCFTYLDGSPCGIKEE